MLQLVIDNPKPVPPAYLPYPVPTLHVVGNPNDADVATWEEALRSGLPILRPDEAFDDL
ncbi:MAG: hypothetical protein NVV60_00245 [Luteimonas sp.]|nr:hypothetical protein [Luteimonas sp.]